MEILQQFFGFGEGDILPSPIPCRRHWIYLSSPSLQKCTVSIIFIRFLSVFSFTMIPCASDPDTSHAITSKFWATTRMSYQLHCRGVLTSPAKVSFFHRYLIPLAPTSHHHLILFFFFRNMFYWAFTKRLLFNIIHCFFQCFHSIFPTLANPFLVFTQMRT